MHQAKCLQQLGGENGYFCRENFGRECVFNAQFICRGRGHFVEVENRLQKGEKGVENSLHKMVAVEGIPY